MVDKKATGVIRNQNWLNLLYTIFDFRFTINKYLLMNEGGIKEKRKDV